MGKLERRNQHMVKFFTIGNWIPPDSLGSSGHGGSVDPKDEKESESITEAQHGRLNVRAAVKTVSVPDVSDDEGESMMLEDSSKGRASGASDRKRISHLETSTQYRLNASRPSNSFASKTLRLVGISTSTRGIYDDAGSEDDGCSCWGFAPNSLVTKYLHWTFRRSFLAVFFSAAVGFFGLTLCFGLLIFWMGQSRPECVHVNGETFSNYTGSTSYRDFGDAYALSWTSFSTVVSAWKAGVTDFKCCLRPF